MEALRGFALSSHLHRDKGKIPRWGMDGETFAVSEEREVPGDVPIIAPFETELTPAILGTLDKQAVIRGMNAELASLKSFKVYDVIPRSQVPQGKAVITGRWVVTPKGDKIKCRMVARELNDGTPADVFAHTPSSTALRIILCIALAKGYAMAKIGRASCRERVSSPV